MLEAQSVCSRASRQAAARREDGSFCPAARRNPHLPSHGVGVVVDRLSLVASPVGVEGWLSGWVGRRMDE